MEFGTEEHWAYEKQLQEQKAEAEYMEEFYHMFNFHMRTYWHGDNSKDSTASVLNIPLQSFDDEAWEWLEHTTKPHESEQE